MADFTIKVVDKNTKNPIANVNVIGPGNVSKKTNSDGKVTFSLDYTSAYFTIVGYGVGYDMVGVNLPPGEHVVPLEKKPEGTIISDSYVDRVEYDGYICDKRRITLDNGQTFYNYINCVIKEKHNRIWGYVKGPLGESIVYATVTFADKTAITDSEGKYEIKDVWFSGEIKASAPGYKEATKTITAPEEGDLQVDFTLEQQPVEVDLKPIGDQLGAATKQIEGVKDNVSGAIKDLGKGTLTSNLLQKLQLDAIKTQGEIDKTYLATALRQVGLDDWADKYNEIYDWLTENFGVEIIDPTTGEKKKIIILTAGFSASLEGLASKLGLSTLKSALTRAGGAIAATIGGLKASNLIKGITGVMGTVIFAEFICEEAVQAAGIGIYKAMHTRSEEVLKQAIENNKNILNAAKVIHEHIKYLDPIGFSFDAFFEAAENNIANYEKVLAHYEEKENYGKLKITSKPSYAEIWINDEPSGYLTPETLKIPIGVYRITIKANGYHDKVFDAVEIEGDKTTELRAELERMKIGYLQIRSRPSQAAIYINGIDTKLLTPQKFELEEGKYTITL
ncbi:MAG: hypothetical protein DRP55_09525, partial [Spirochaetes bacterium]